MNLKLHLSLRLFVGFGGVFLLGFFSSFFLNDNLNGFVGKHLQRWINAIQDVFYSVLERPGGQKAHSVFLLLCLSGQQLLYISKSKWKQ